MLSIYTGLEFCGFVKNGKDKFLDSSKLKDFADNSFKMGKNGKNSSKSVENIKEKKMLIMSNF